MPISLLGVSEGLAGGIDLVYEKYDLIINYTDDRNSGFSTVFGNFTIDEFNSKFDEYCPNASVTADDFTVTFSGLSVSSIEGFAKFIKEYVPPFCLIVCTSLGCSWNAWDSKELTWNEIDALKMPFNILDTLEE